MVIWWSKSEVTVGHQGGEGIHVDAGASESIFSKGFVPEQVNQESGGISLAGLCWKKWRLHNVGLLILRQIFSSIIFFLSKTGLLVLGVGCSFLYVHGAVSSPWLVPFLPDRSMGEILHWWLAIRCVRSRLLSAARLCTGPCRVHRLYWRYHWTVPTLPTPLTHLRWWQAAVRRCFCLWS